MEHASPLFLTSSFTYENAEDMRAAFADEVDANIYSRFSNPNVQEFIDRVCALEGAEAGFATASGMAAIFGTFMTFLKAGDHLVSCSSIFGSTHSLITKYLVRWGITFTYADVTQPDTWESLIRPNTRMIFLETPTNPGLDIIDLEWVSALAQRTGTLLVVDNCFATPIGQQPIAYGADLVIHSATKWMDGQGRVLGGVVVGREELIKEIYLLCRTTGPALSPFNAWVLSKSLETLEVRMDRHASSALSIAQTLEGHPLAHLGKISLPAFPSTIRHRHQTDDQWGRRIVFRAGARTRRGHSVFGCLGIAEPYGQPRGYEEYCFAPGFHDTRQTFGDGKAGGGDYAGVDPDLRRAGTS